METVIEMDQTESKDHEPICLHCTHFTYFPVKGFGWCDQIGSDFEEVVLHQGHSKCRLGNQNRLIGDLGDRETP
jgi:hypothetical protein